VFSLSGFKLHVKTGRGEIEIESADVSSLREIVEAASKLFETLSAVSEHRSVQEGLVQEKIVEERQPAAASLPETPELPVIKIEKDDSLPSILVKMFSTQWGRKPRKLMEVKEALDSYGIIHPKQSVAVALMRLAKDGKLRRFKLEGEYVYVAGPEIMSGGEERGAWA